MAKPILTLERLKELLSYNPEDGNFTFLTNVRGYLRKGKTAGSVDKNGYLTARIDGPNYFLHRLAWLYMTGQWPKDVIDHIDCNPINNRFANLRDISRGQNQQNRRRAEIGSKSGLLGAHYRARDNNWIAHIKAANCKMKYLGTFNTPEEAHAAYVAAKRLLHPFGTL